LNRLDFYPVTVTSRRRGLLPHLGVLLALGILVGGAGTGASAASPGAAAVLWIAEHDGLWSAEVRDVPLTDLLHVLAERAGFALKVRGPRTGSITDRFEALPIEAALGRLARGHSLGLVYGVSPSGTETLAEVWLIAADQPTPPGENQHHAGARLRHGRGPQRGAQPGAVTELALILSRDEDPTARAQAAALLGREGTQEALGALASALDDADASVRIQIVRALVSAGREEVADDVARVLLGDHDPLVRRAAAFRLGMLRSGIAGIALRTAADTDRDDAVRATAAAALARWQRLR
jgi:hypothetical protein